MKKFLLLVLVSFASLSSNAQRNQSTGTTETWEPRYTGQFDFYVQDAWGGGLMFRREFTPNFGLNLIGGSFMSGWGEYETPDNVGIVNVRLMGLRLNAPLGKRFGVYADATPGYTYMYVDTFFRTTTLWGQVKGDAHCFGLDLSVGFLIDKHLSLGYNYSLFVNGNGNSGIHWGRFSIIF